MSPRRLFTPSSHHLLLLAIFLAAFLRFWQLGEMPPGLYHDEAYNGLDALSMLQGKTFPQFYEGWELYAQDAHAENPPTPTRWPLFFEGNYGREPAHIYLMALSIWLLGATPLAIRVIPATAGVLALLTTYLAAKAIFRDEERELTAFVPILAAFALAILFPAVHFSRFGLRMMLFVPVETLAVYFFWRGLGGAGVGDQWSQGGWGEGVRGEILWFVLAGVMLGAGVYVYAVGRLLPLLFVGFVLFWFWQDRAALRRFWRPVAVMAGASLVTAVPLLLFFAQYPYFFVFRIAYVANKGKGAVEGKAWLTWLLNIGRTVRGLFWLGETHLRHNLPGRPYLDPVQAVTFAVGLIATLRQKLQPRAVFLLLWLIVMLLPTIMSGDAPHFGRMTGAAPVISIFLALGLAKLTQLIQARISPHSQFTIHNSEFIILFLLAASLFFTVRDYFFRYANHPQLAADFYLPDWELGQYAAAQPADAALYFTPTQEEMATIYYALADPERLRSYAGGQGLISAGEEGQTAVYLLRPEATQALAELQAFFPTGYVAAERPNFIAFHVPADAPRLLVDETAPLDFANATDAITLRGWQVKPMDAALDVTLVWQAQTPIGQDYTAFVHLLNVAGELVAQVDRPPAGYPTSDWRMGEIVQDAYRMPLPPDLPSGQYTVQTGFYSWPELVGLGETAVLAPLTLP